MIGDDLSRSSGAAVYVRLYIVASFSSSYFSLAKRSRGKKFRSFSSSLLPYRLAIPDVALSLFVSRNDAIVVHYLFDSSLLSRWWHFPACRASRFGKKQIFFVSWLFMWKLSSNANRFWQNSLQNPENDITWSLDYVDDIRKIFLCGEAIKMYRLMRNFFCLQNRKLY